MAKNKKNGWIIFITLAVVILILCWGWKTAQTAQTTENYGTVLGQLAPYKAQMFGCLGECERSDPNRRWMPEANLACGKYCQSTITSLARNAKPPEDYPVIDNYTKCHKQCDVDGATRSEKRKCMSLCYGHHSVADWCKETQCPYSLWNEKECIRQCFLNQNTNNNFNAWEWKMSR